MIDNVKYHIMNDISDKMLNNISKKPKYADRHNKEYQEFSEEIIGYVMHAYNIKQDNGTENILNAFKRVDRRNFIPQEFVNEALGDYPLHISKGQTNTTPSTVLYMTLMLAPKEGDNIFEIGTGSGWQGSLLAEVVGSKGKVVTVEIISSLREQAIKNISNFDKDLLDRMILENDTATNILETYENDFFHGMIVTAGVKDKNILKTITPVLKEGGRVVIPLLENENTKMKYTIYTYEKKDGALEKITELKETPWVSYVDERYGVSRIDEKDQERDAIKFRERLKQTDLHIEEKLGKQASRYLHEIRYHPQSRFRKYIQASNDRKLYEIFNLFIELSKMGKLSIEDDDMKAMLEVLLERVELPEDIGTAKLQIQKIADGCHLREDSSQDLAAADMIIYLLEHSQGDEKRELIKQIKETYELDR